MVFLRLLDTGKVMVEYDGLDAKLYVYKNGAFVGCELLTECVRHLLDESPLEEYRKEEVLSKRVS